MTRRTIRIGTDWMLDVDLHGHGWEIVVLDSDGVAQDLWIEPDLESRDLRLHEVGGTLVTKSFRGADD